jgi:hypothetical protein
MRGEWLSEMSWGELLDAAEGVVWGDQSDAVDPKFQEKAGLKLGEDVGKHFGGKKMERFNDRGKKGELEKNQDKFTGEQADKKPFEKEHVEKNTNNRLGKMQTKIQTRETKGPKIPTNYERMLSLLSEKDRRFLDETRQVGRLAEVDEVTEDFERQGRRSTSFTRLEEIEIIRINGEKEWMIVKDPEVIKA